MRGLAALVGTLMPALAVPGVALADHGHRPTASAAGTLPFTGLDVVLLVVGVGALAVAGLIVSRVAGRLG